MENHFELIIVGAGPGGYVAAIKAAQLGFRTAIVEAREVGGTCLNRGYIPAKAMIHAADLYREMNEAGRYGLHAENVSVNYDELLAYKEDTTRKLVGGVEQLLSGNGVTLLCGHGLVHADKTVRLTDSEGRISDYSADNIIVASGSEPIILPVPGMELEGVLTSDGLFRLTELPESLVIIGGGVIGVEFATAFCDLGTRVTIVEGSPRLVPNLDKEISQNLRMIMKRRGVEIHTGAMVGSVTKDDEHDELIVQFMEKDKPVEARGRYVLCSVGRRANTNGVFAPGEEPEMNRGRIRTNERFETSIPGIYAIGDCTEGIQLAHAAEAQGIACVEMLRGEMPSVDTNVVPSCVYTSPEIASVGLTEEEAEAQGLNVRVGKYLTASNGKSMITREERGFVKIIIDADTERVLGCQMMCARATDMISEFTVAVADAWTVRDLLRAVRPHPTYNESIGEALETFEGGSIHALGAKTRRK